MDYELDVPKALMNVVPRHWHTFCEKALEDLRDVKEKQAPGVYHGTVSKSAWNGAGSIIMENGDIYKGNFKNGARSGPGLCQFASGALYRGEWRDDVPHGGGILYSGNGEILECRFEHGAVAGSSAVGSGFTNHAGKIKIMFSDGSYYEGQYRAHGREGFGAQWYPNGDKYDGHWTEDGRVGRGKLFFVNGSHYFG